jgi:hypothetical protein
VQEAGIDQAPPDGLQPVVVPQPPPDRVDGPVAVRPDGVEHCGLDGMAAARVRHGELAGRVDAEAPVADEVDQGRVDHPGRAAGQEGDVVEVQLGAVRGRHDRPPS